MNVYDVNLDVIKKYKPKLYEDINKFQSYESDNLVTHTESIDTKEEQSALLIEVKNKKYRLNSNYYPTNEAKKWVEQYNFKNLAIVVSMFGFGNGVFVRELLEHLPSDGKMFVYEPSLEIFQYVLNEYDLTDLWKNPKLKVFVGEKNRLNFLNNVSGNTHWTNVYSQIICKHPQYEKAFLEYYRDFLVIINENNERTFINRNTESFFGKTIVENTIANLYSVNGANTVLEYLDKIPKDVPAIIVSAGPSLDKNIDELKRAKGKSVIVATDTALRHLFAHDINPDFVVTMDPEKPPEYFANPRCKDVPMFCKIEANHKIMKEHTARKILFSCHPYVNTMYSKFGKKISSYQAGGSVATGAFSICAALKFNRIVLIGQDLAYGNGVTHAGGEISSVHAEEEGIRMIEDIYGNMIKTRHDWYIYLNWFVNSIESVPDIEVIDATEGGAKIKGAKLMTLSDVIDQYCTKMVNCAEIVESIAPTLSNDNLSEIKRMIENSVSDLDKIFSKASKAVPICNKLIKASKANTLDHDDNKKLIGKITKINNFIESTLVYSLVDSYIADEAAKRLSKIYQMSDDVQEDQIKTFERAKGMYEIIQDAVKVIRPMFVEALNTYWE
jgi:hypothetical protein